MKRYYVGLACTCHDPALAILDADGQVLYAEALERYLQHKRTWDMVPDNLSFTPELVRRYCDPQGEFVLAMSWTRKVYALMLAYYLTGRFSLGRLLAPGEDRASPMLFERYKVNWLSSTLFSSIRKAGAGFAVTMRDQFANTRVRATYHPHHRAHAAYACYSSPYERAMCMIVDGFGEFGSHSFYAYERGRLRPIAEVKGYGSLGYLYGRLTELCGFDWFKGEDWKVMGLAPYGQVDRGIYDRLMSIIKVDGLRMRFSYSLKALDRCIAELKAVGLRPGERPEAAADLAATGQQVFEDLMQRFLVHFHGLGDSDNLVLAGGCALNSTFNGKIVEQTPFTSVFVPSAPADDGNAVGAAWLALQADRPEWRPTATVHSPYLGSEVSADTLERLVRFGRLPGLRHLPGQVHHEAARIVAEGGLVGWVQGRAEFGPRALGNRSILADPRSPGMKDKINALVKFREEYRPFAPSILHEYGDEYFEHYQETPYMERTLRFRPEVRARVPAVVHVNGTGRLQTVKHAWNPRYYDLIAAFHARTGVPIVLNTSFNIMGKPIIHSVEDAIGLLYTTGLDALAIGDYLLEKPST